VTTLLAVVGTIVIGFDFKATSLAVGFMFLGVIGHWHFPRIESLRKRGV
jgi:hypothetical protein